MANLLEGRLIAEEIKEGLRRQIQGLAVKPVLASLLAGNNAGAETYVRSQKKTAESIGIEYKLHKLDADIKEDDLIELIKRLNSDKSVNGIIVQMPLPNGIDYRKISRCIIPQKDVEGMHPDNLGKLLFGKATILPCTPAAVMELLRVTGLDLYGKEVVVVGHSEIVGKPLSLLLLEKFATVTVAHIGTSQAGKLQDHIRRAEVLIVAVGKAGLIRGEWIKDGAIVIDVGINRVGDKIVGDVEFEAAERRAAYITPVPGGVGPLTVTMLMRNLIEAVRLQL
ncbi:MAG: bifunctional 5,10-methylenetetrahydrofolate dehydrogenase/5,10-methenyltetrahydrofolate cyclohydrolase [Candidatus Omnitrophica bacterium]|nr:bifunctional 5,10-methylenetetrahydrofolate dehydrogenase/5,10-methenyltetrahydrofolate cyclohydrolase [Candidatus Omnitrophota bacterium]